MRSKYFLKHWDVFLMVFIGITIIIGSLPRHSEFFVTGEDEYFLGIRNEEDGWLRPDSLLTYSGFQSLQRTIESRKKQKRRMDEGNIVRGMYVGMWGVATGSASADLFTSKESDKRYYFALNDFALKHDISRFKVVNGERRILYTNKIPRKDNVVEYAKVTSVKVPYIFQDVTTRDTPVQQRNRGRILIEISKSAHQVLGVAIRAGWIIFFACIYILLALPLKMVIRISQGKAFSARNVRALHLIAVTLLIMSWGGIVLRFILQFIFRHTLTDEVYVPVGALLHDNMGLMMGAIAVLATAKAFKKGLSLQKEQEFTI